MYRYIKRYTLNKSGLKFIPLSVNFRTITNIYSNNLLLLTRKIVFSFKLQVNVSKLTSSGANFILILMRVPYTCSEDVIQSKSRGVNAKV